MLSLFKTLKSEITVKATLKFIELLVSGLASLTFYVKMSQDEL